MPYTVPVHPGDASQLALDSATLLLLDGPSELIFGIDCMVRNICFTCQAARPPLCGVLSTMLCRK
jgi:hypothetical protein